MNKLSSFCSLLMLLVSIAYISAQHKDCTTALELCGNSPFYLFPDAGDGSPDSDVSNTCVSQEVNSMWVEWTVTEAGSITFFLIPDHEDQDIDFVLYRLDDPDDCPGKTPIRCMAAGANVNLPPQQWINCTGVTGLAPGETDVEEPPGCPSGSNNFLAPVEALAGEQFKLLINNFTGGDFGYTLRFGGTAVLNCITTSADAARKESPLTFDVYPTVSGGHIYIDVHGAGLTEVFLYMLNMEGQVVYSGNHQAGSPFQLDLNHLPGGAYNAVLKTSNSSIVKRFILTK
jgi:hypothetical protein